MASKSWSRSTTRWSWRRIAACSSASWLLAVSPAAAAPALAAGAPPPLAIECDPGSVAAHANDADMVFTGEAVETFEDRAKPAPWIPAPVVQRWPAGLPLPTVQSPGPGVPAVRFRASVGYKGPVATEVVVHLLGTGPRISKGQTWTVFANRDADLGLFTTECSGDQRGALADPASAGLTAEPVGAGDWRSALAAPLLALLAIAALAGGLALLARRLTEHGAVEHLPE